MFSFKSLSESAIGKALKVLGFVFVSTGLTALATHLTSNPDLLGVAYTGIAIAVVNATIVFIQKARDPKVPTLPQ